MNPQEGFQGLVMILVFVPLFYFLFRNLSGLDGAKQAAIQRAAAERPWKEPDPYFVDLPAALTISVVEETLPNYFYDKNAWEIINVEKGNPTTIAASIVCIEEIDPGSTERFDVGLAVTIVDQRPANNCTGVKLTFIVYEGEGPCLERICTQTYQFLEKALRAQSGFSAQPQAVLPAVGGEQPSSGLPAENAADFFLQSSNRAAEEKREGGVFSAEEGVPGSFQDLPGRSMETAANETSFAPGHEFEPKKKSDFQSPQMEQVRGFVAPPAVSSAGDLVSPVAQAVSPAEAEAPLGRPLEGEGPAPVLSSQPAAAGDTDLSASAAAATAPDAAAATNAANPGSSSAAGGAGLCPACSQPINPAFPFCLYCSKSF